MLYHGPVRVPEDARDGAAAIELHFSKNAGLESLPTILKVELTK